MPSKKRRLHKHLRGMQLFCHAPWSMLLGAWTPQRCKPGSEDLGRAFQRFPDAPGQRDTDKGPEQRRPDIQPAFADAERAMLDRRLALGACRLQLGDLDLAHVPLRINRLDQEV